MLFVVDLLHALVAVHSELVPLAVVAGIEDRIYLILVQAECQLSHKSFLITQITTTSLFISLHHVLVLRSLLQELYAGFRGALDIVVFNQDKVFLRQSYSSREYL